MSATLYPIPGIDACERCREPGDAYDEKGRWRCVDCMFDEADEPPVLGPENRATGGGAAANTRSAAAPIDDDIRARQAIEGTRYENL